MKNIVIANWKMNTTPTEGVKLFNLVRQRLGRQQEVEVVICPPFTHLAKFDLKSSSLKLGAQNMSTESAGAFTGEVSANMLSDLGVQFVIIGHSERRDKFSEDSVVVGKKFRLALLNNLTPVLCVGESLKERKDGETLTVILKQIKEILDPIFKDDLGVSRNFLIAYEPIWSVGTGDTPSPEEIRNVSNIIREFLNEAYTEKKTRSIRLLYGGSVNAKNVTGFIRNKQINGFLVGAASLNLKEFVGIANKNK